MLVPHSTITVFGTGWYHMGPPDQWRMTRIGG